MLLDNGDELPFDLFLGVSKHRAPAVVIDSGMTEDGYIPVDSATLQTRFPGVRGRVGSVDIDFLSGPSRTGSFNPLSADLVADKERFGSSRRSRWFGLP